MIITIDTDALIKAVSELPENCRQEYILTSMRELCQEIIVVPWAKPAGAKPAEKKMPSDYTPEFNYFWHYYPNKTGKKAAFRSWWSATQKNFAGDEKAMLECCAAALKWQKNKDQWKKDHGQFVPQPTTWLNQERWMDEPPKETDTGERYLSPDGTWRTR